jgi:hypothetical protein
MGFSIGSFISNVGKSIGNAVISTVKEEATKVLKDVVGQSGFDNIKNFASTAATAASNLQNPLDLSSLLEKAKQLLPSDLSGNSLADLIKKFTESMIPREVPGANGANATLPPLSDRASGTAAATAGVDAAIGLGNIPTGQSFEDKLGAAAAAASDPANFHEATEAELNNMTEGQMIAYQAKMQKHARLMDMYSKLLQAQNDMKKGIIGNFRV